MLNIILMIIGVIFLVIALYLASTTFNQENFTWDFGKFIPALLFGITGAVFIAFGIITSKEEINQSPI